MKRTICQCDRCGREATQSTIYACVDRCMGAAGSSEDVCEPVDLCDACGHFVLRQLVEKMDYEQAKRFHKTATIKPLKAQVPHG